MHQEPLVTPFLNRSKQGYDGDPQACNPLYADNAALTNYDMFCEREERFDF